MVYVTSSASDSCSVVSKLVRGSQGGEISLCVVCAVEAVEAGETVIKSRFGES